jgi:MFS family permease
MTAAKRSPLLIIFLVVFIDLVGFGIVIPILPYYAKAYGASATTLGWLMTSYSGMQFFFSPLWGRLSDKIGRRPVLLLSMTGIMVSMVGLGLARSLAGLFAARLFAGICGANISTATAYIADVTSEKDRAKGMGMIGAAFGLGFILGPAIGGTLSPLGYPVPMFAAAALSALNILFAYVRLPEPDITEELREQHRTKRFDLAALKETMSDSRTRMATILFLIVTVAITQMEVTFALFMQARHGYDARGAGWFLAYMGLIMAAVQGGFIGRLSRKFGEAKLVACGTALMAVALVAFAHALTPVGIFISLAILAFGNGITNPSLSSLASKGAKPEHRGATMGIYQSAGSLARVIGPPIAGAVYDLHGIATPFLLSAALAGLALWLVLIWKIGSQSWLREATRLFRKDGIKGLVKRYGWRIVAAFFAYYLIRDMTLYILLPWMAARGLLAL